MVATPESEQYKFEFVVHMQLQLDIATTYKGYRIIIRSACLFSVSYRPEERIVIVQMHDGIDTFCRSISIGVAVGGASIISFQ